MIEFGNMDGNLKPLTIIGITGDVRARGLDSPPSPIIYVDYRQRGMNANSTPTIVMRSTEPAGNIVSAAHDIFLELAPDVPVKISTFAGDGRLARRSPFSASSCGTIRRCCSHSCCCRSLRSRGFLRRAPHPGDQRPYSAWRAAQRRTAFGIRTRVNHGGPRSRSRYWRIARDQPTDVLASLRHRPTDPLTFVGVALLVSHRAWRLVHTRASCHACRPCKSVTLRMISYC